MTDEIDLISLRTFLDQTYIEEALKNIDVQDDRFSCIDIGCGPGISTKILCDFFKKHNIIGIDNCENIINYAIAHNNNNNIKYICADARSIPYSDQSFDLCFSRMLLDIAPQTDEILNEMIRIVKHDGYIILYGNIRTTALGNIQPLHAKKILHAYQRYVRITKRKGFDVNYIVNMLSNNNFSCQVKRIIKDVNTPGRSHLIKYYSIDDLDIHKYADNNIFVKLHLLSKNEIVEYERDLNYLLHNNEAKLTFEQAIIIAKR